MSHIPGWLGSVDDTPIESEPHNLRSSEDFDFRDWIHDPPDGGYEPSNPDESIPENRQQHTLPEPVSARQSAQDQHGVIAQDAPAHARSIPTQASPDFEPSQWPPTSPDPNQYSYDALYHQLQEFAGSPDLSHNQQQDLPQFDERSPSQYQYPDPTSLDAHYTNPLNGPRHPYPAGASPQPSTQMHDLDNLWQHDNRYGEFVPPQTDFSFSPPGSFAPLVFPEHDDFAQVQAPARRIAQSKGKGRTSSTSTSENPNCIDCGKKYRTSGSPGRCTRCGMKYERKVAQPFTYTLDRNVPDFATARRLIFSPIEGRQIYQDDVHRYIRDPTAEDGFVQHLLDAINFVQNSNDADKIWAVRQQKTFNEKAKLETGYTNALVTARLRALYREVLNYHLGGDAVYAVGGDNAGYADDRILKFSQRMMVICNVLRENKRVVMDIVEGRGLQGFVSNPKKYNERKASNNNCNMEKKRVMEKGKEIEAEMGSVTSVGKGKRARTVEVVSPEPEVVDDFGEGPSRKRVRGGQEFDPTYSPSVYESVEYGPGKPMQAEWLRHGRRD